MLKQSTCNGYTLRMPAVGSGSFLLRLQLGHDTRGHSAVEYFVDGQPAELYEGRVPHLLVKPAADTPTRAQLTAPTLSKAEYLFISDDTLEIIQMVAISLLPPPAHWLGLVGQRLKKLLGREERSTPALSK